MACCVLIGELIAFLLRLVRRDAESQTDPDVLESVTAARPAGRKGINSVR
jgi:hypothetical protein